MAQLFTFSGVPGMPHYGVIATTGALVWDGVAYVPMSDASRNAGAIPAAEVETTGLFKGEFPAAIPAGPCMVFVYRRAGAQPATSDPLIASGPATVAAEGEPPVPPTPIGPGQPLDMIPMPESMYPDVIRIRRKTDVTSGGRLKHEYGPAGAHIPARVDSLRVDRQDASGRVSVRTLHMVTTALDYALDAEDMLVWVDRGGTSRNLIAEGPSVPHGLGDIEYYTDTFQIV